MHNTCKGVPKCNKFAEITFGYTDVGQNISTLVCEAYALFTSKT